MSAIGTAAGAPHGKTFAISAYADVRHDHLCFERQQSLTLREMEWEDRIRPPTPWITLIGRGLGMAVLACAVLAMLI